MRPERLVVSQHACDRYHERWCCDRIGSPCSDVACGERAAKELNDDIERGVSFVHFDGDFIYKTHRGTLLVCAPDGTVRTVLPQGAVRKIRRPRLRRGWRPPK